MDSKPIVCSVIHLRSSLWRAHAGAWVREKLPASHIPWFPRYLTSPRTHAPAWAREKLPAPLTSPRSHAPAWVREKLPASHIPWFPRYLTSPGSRGISHPLVPAASHIPSFPRSCVGTREVCSVIRLRSRLMCPHAGAWVREKYALSYACAVDLCVPTRERGYERISHPLVPTLLRGYERSMLCHTPA